MYAPSRKSNSKSHGGWIRVRVLVTGAAGFIGTHLCRRLLRSGFSVRGLLVHAESSSTLERMGVEIVRGDLLEPSSLQGITDGVDIVYHLAARVTDWGRWEDFWNITVHGTERLLELSWKHCKKFIYVSSIAAYGVGRTMRGFTEDTPCVKTGVPYGDSKMEAEKRVMDYHGKRGISCTIVRPANVIGPGSVWVKDALDAFRRGPVPLIDGGRHSASLLAVENLVDGIVLASMNKASNGQCFNFRDPWSVTWRQYLTDLGAMIDRRPSFTLPFGAAWTVARIFEALCRPFNLRPPLTRMAVGIVGRDNAVSTQKAHTLLGWRSRLSYEKTMQRIQTWVKEHYVPSLKGA